MKNLCNCASTFEVRLARAQDYPAWKKLLDLGRHPAFIGRTTMSRNAANGGALFYLVHQRPVAVSLVNPHFGILLALNVLPHHRSHGLGTAIVQFLMPNFVRAIETKVPYFQKLGYRPIGPLKRGISLNTQIMARAALFDLAGKLARVWGTAAERESAPPAIGRQK